MTNKVASKVSFQIRAKAKRKLMEVIEVLSRSQLRSVAIVLSMMKGLYLQTPHHQLNHEVDHWPQ